MGGGADQGSGGRIGTRMTNQGPAGRIRASRDGSGPIRTYQGSAGRIRAHWDRSGPYGTDQEGFPGGGIGTSRDGR